MVVRNVLRGVYSVGVTPRVSLLGVLPLAGPRKPTPPEEPAQSIRHGAVVVRSVGVLEVAIRGVSLRPLTPPSAVQGRRLNVPPDAACAAACHSRLDGRTHVLTVSAAVKTRLKKLEAFAHSRYTEVAGASSM